MRIKWDKYVDHIYCVNYVGHEDRQEYLNNEMMRVDILNSGIYTNFYNINTPFYKYISNNYYNKEDYNYAIDCTLGHYFCIKQAYQLGYEKIVIFENDVVFLKDKQFIEDILEQINNIDFDILCCECQHIAFSESGGYHENVQDYVKENIKNKKININEITSGFIGVGAGMNMYTRSGMKHIIDFFELGHYCTIDEYCKYIDIYPKINIKYLMPTICIQNKDFFFYDKDLYNFHVDENAVKGIMDLTYKLFNEEFYFTYTPSSYYYHSVKRTMEEERYYKKYNDDYIVSCIICNIENNNYDKANELYNKLNKDNIKLYNPDIINIINCKLRV